MAFLESLDKRSENDILFNLKTGTSTSLANSKFRQTWVYISCKNLENRLCPISSYSVTNKILQIITKILIIAKDQRIPNSLSGLGDSIKIGTFISKGPANAIKVKVSLPPQFGPSQATKSWHVTIIAYMLYEASYFVISNSISICWQNRELKSFTHNLRCDIVHLPFTHKGESWSLICSFIREWRCFPNLKNRPCLY